jgi:hypothetical protein
MSEWPSKSVEVEAGTLVAAYAGSYEVATTAANHLKILTKWQRTSAVAAGPARVRIRAGIGVHGG